jgi:hypothetical protein
VDKAFDCKSGMFEVVDDVRIGFDVIVVVVVVVVVDDDEEEEDLGCLGVVDVAR